MNLQVEFFDRSIFENMTIQELIEISTLIDNERINPGSLSDMNTQAAQIAQKISNLINEESSACLGIQLYEELNELIVSRNALLTDTSESRQLFEKISEKPSLGAYYISRHNGSYKFVLKSSSGEILAVSELYSKIDSCLNGIESVRRNSEGQIENLTKKNEKAISNPKFEVYCDKNAEFRFRLKAKNGEIIAVSRGYKSEDECLAGIQAVKENAKTEYIEKM